MCNPERSKQSDAALVAASLEGDHEAFGRLYDRFARLVRALIYDAFLDYTVTQDLTQETFLRAYHKLGSLRNWDGFGSWVAGIAKQVCREKRRSLHRDRHQFVADYPFESTGPEDETSLDSDEEKQFVLRQVAELPEKERLAIHYFYLMQRNAEETAALLDVSRSSVYELLHRGCRRVAEQVRCRES